MAVADITVANLIEYIHEDPDNSTLSGQVDMLRTAAIAYIRSYTNQTIDYINEHDEFDPVLMVLVADMYDTRSYRVDNDEVNPFVQSILDMHRIGLL